MYRPWVGRKIGIELEISANRRPHDDEEFYEGNALKDLLRPHVLHLNSRPVGWYKSTGNSWDVKTDATCGYEIASPVFTLDEQGHNPELKRVCDALNQFNPIVNRKCGFHLHMDLTDFDWKDLKNLLILWTRYEPFFFEMQPAHRRNNSYCPALFRSSWTGQPGYWWPGINRGLQATTKAEFTQNVRNDSRLALNYGGFWRHQRVEVRLHSGTINYNKIRYWAMLMMALAGRVKHESLPPIRHVVAATTSGFEVPYVLKGLGLVASQYISTVPIEAVALLQYIKQRRAQFHPRLESSQAVPTPTPRPRRTRVSGQTWSEILGQSIVLQAQEISLPSLWETHPAPREGTWTITSDPGQTVSSDSLIRPPLYVDQPSEPGPVSDEYDAIDRALDQLNINDR